jgi:hypothetical protein
MERCSKFEFAKTKSPLGKFGLVLLIKPTLTF